MKLRYDQPRAASNVSEVIHRFSEPSKYATDQDKMQHERLWRGALSRDFPGLLTEWSVEFMFNGLGGYPAFRLHFRDAVTRLGNVS